jgi:hypothetical protein
MRRCEETNESLLEEVIDLEICSSTENKKVQIKLWDENQHWKEMLRNSSGITNHKKRWAHHLL